MADEIPIRKSWEAELEHPSGGRPLFIVEDPRVPQTYFYSAADAEAAAPARRLPLVLRRARAELVSGACLTPREQGTWDEPL